MARQVSAQQITHWAIFVARLAYACQYGFRSYSTWEEGYRDWYQLILLGYVQGQITIPIVGQSCRTVEQIIPVYAPSSDGNNVSAYIHAVLGAVRAWRAGSISV